MITIKELITNPDGTKNLLVTKNNCTLQLHSSRPLLEANKMFAQLSQTSEAFFLGGLGMGYLLETIFQHTDKICVVFEPPSDIFDKVLSARPELKKILSHPNILFTQEISEISHFLQEKKLSDISFSIQRSYVELFPDILNKTKDIIHSHIRAQEISNSTLLRFGKIWTKNFFKNMYRYFYSDKLINYQNKHPNKPAIIIGAGPSLYDALPFLKTHSDRALLIACDTALPILHKAKISPDFVVTLDAQEKNALYLRYTFDKNHKLIADPSVHDSTFEGYADENIILMDSTFPLYKLFEDFWGACKLLKSGGSVSTSAFDFARFISADPIIMVGQDLAFTKNKTHTNGHILSQFDRNRHHRLNSYYTEHIKKIHATHSQMIKGRTLHSYVPADVRLIMFKDWFSQEIPITQAHVIVAGLDGAYLQGATHLSLSEAFDTLSKSLDKTTIQTCIQHPCNSVNNHSYLKFLDDIDLATEKLIPICQQTLLTIKKAIVTQNLSMAIQASTKLQNSLALSTNQKISQLISLTVQNSIQSAMSMPDIVSDSEHLALIKQICTDIHTGILNLQKNIRKAQKISLKKSKKS